MNALFECESERKCVCVCMYVCMCVYVCVREREGEGGDENREEMWGKEREGAEREMREKDK